MQPSPIMEQESQGVSYAKRQRWSGLWNGVVIGMGLAWILFGQLIGVLPLGLGIIMEIMQRRVRRNMGQ